MTGRMRRLWPSLAIWLGGLDAESQDGIRERWRLVLFGVDKVYAEQAVQLLATSPDDPWPYPGDKERAAAIVAAKASEIRRAKAASVREAQQVARPKRGEYRSDGLWARFLRAIAEDGRHDEDCVEHRRAKGRCRPGCRVPLTIAAELSAEPCGLKEDQQRFDCSICRDSGYVSCLKAREVARIATTRRVLAGAATYALRCTCRHAKQRDERYPDFDRNRDIPINQSPREIVTACVALVEQLQDAASRVDSEGRVSAFEAWNSQEVA